MNNRPTTLEDEEWQPNTNANDFAPSTSDPSRDYSIYPHIVRDAEGEGQYNAARQPRDRKHPEDAIELSVELERVLVGELGRIAEVDGLASVYQVIRNACYNYVRYRNGRRGLIPLNNQPYRQPQYRGFRREDRGEMRRF